MPGYSGTPLPVKLGVKDNFRVAAVDMPPDVSALLSGAIAACIKTSKAPLDCAMLFVKTRAQLAKQFSGIASALAPAGMLWVAWPKKHLEYRPTLMKMKCAESDWRRAWWTSKCVRLRKSGPV